METLIGNIEHLVRELMVVDHVVHESLICWHKSTTVTGNPVTTWNNLAPGVGLPSMTSGSGPSMTTGYLSRPMLSFNNKVMSFGTPLAGFDFHFFFVVQLANFLTIYNPLIGNDNSDEDFELSFNAGMGEPGLILSASNYVQISNIDTKITLNVPIIVEMILNGSVGTLYIHDSIFGTSTVSGQISPDSHRAIVQPFGNQDGYGFVGGAYEIYGHNIGTLPSTVRTGILGQLSRYWLGIRP